VEAPFGPAWAAYWPYPDHIVLGGTAVEDDEDREPDPAVAERIRQRCIEVEPRLRNARVLGHQVGLRPTRPSVRLEIEQLARARCVHNYGHGGSGVTMSWGCARESAALLTATPERRKASEAVTESDVRRVALSLPATTEKPSYGTPGFRVKDKLFARIREQGDLLV